MTELGSLSQSPPGKNSSELLEDDWDFLEGCGTEKFRMSNRRGNETGNFEVKIVADTTKFTIMIIKRLRKSWDLVRENEMIIADETKIPSWVCGTEWAVVNYSQLLLEVGEKK